MPEPVATTPYKAWLLFAPIWISDLLAEAPTVEPRPLVAAPLLWLAEALSIFLLIPVYSLLNPEWEPCFCFKITDPRWPGWEDTDA